MMEANAHHAASCRYIVADRYISGIGHMATQTQTVNDEDEMDVDEGR